MQALLAVVALLLFGVAVFAFQNADSITVRFLHWQLSAPVGVVTLAAAATGALAAVLASLAARFVKWSRRREPRAAQRDPERQPPEPRPPGLP
jgi:uncharacterized integral membrane protein